jgi:hypothetical protein
LYLQRKKCQKIVEKHWVDIMEALLMISLCSKYILDLLFRQLENSLTLGLDLKRYKTNSLI